MPERLSGEPGRRGVWLAWLLGLPVCVALGAATNYGWHLLHNDPVVQRIEVPQPTELPFQPADQNYEFATEPLPDEIEPREVMNSADIDPLTDNALASAITPAETDTKSTLEKRFMQAVSDTGQSDAIVTATPRPADSEAAPLGALPPRISQQVTAMKYGAHVYSSVPANRTININGRDYHEGDEVVSGVVLLRIDANASIFRVGSQSFSLNALTDWRGY
jgi:general secretion pathway protein B